MTHLQIKSTEDGALSVAVDGHEIGMHILAEGLDLELPTAPGQRALLRCVVVADTLDAELPQALIAATRAEVTQ